MTRPFRRGLSVRARITLAVALLMALGLASAGALVYALEVRTSRAAVVDDVDQEIAELVRFGENGIDPKTRQRGFTSYERLVRTFLKRNVSGSSELLVGVWDGAVQVQSPSSRQGLSSEPDFQRAVLDRVSSGGSTSLDLAEYGEVYLEVLPLRNGGRSALGGSGAGPSGAGAFAAAYFVDDEVDAITGTMRIYAIAALTALAVVTGVAAWVAGRLLSPMRTLRETAQEITETDLSRRIPVTGNDDLSDLTRQLNAMLDRLDHAFRGQRAFLDDAGHELRTPLTVLQGHLELLDPSDEEEVARTRDLLLDETERMGRLVEDMILLTKADRPGFVAADEVDLDGLTDRVLAKMRGLGDRQWTVDARADGTAELDEQRLTQALLQLGHNAVRHTSPGDVVAVGSSLASGAGGSVRFWVRDTGPGVPDADKEAIFRRFARGADAGQEDGSGLGLSIVAAIAAAHGGTAHVEDADGPGRGARFVITLPQHRKDGQWRAS